MVFQNKKAHHLYIWGNLALFYPHSIPIPFPRNHPKQYLLFSGKIISFVFIHYRGKSQ